VQLLDLPAQGLGAGGVCARAVPSPDLA
jgi:hypothetical protein